MCYVIPVAIHLTLLRMGGLTHGSLVAKRGAGQEEGEEEGCPACALAPAGEEDLPPGPEQRAGGGGGGLTTPLLQRAQDGVVDVQPQLAPGSGGSSRYTHRLEARQLAMPMVILGVGVGFSAAGVWVAVQDLQSWLHPSG